MSDYNYTRAAIEDRWDVDTATIAKEVETDLPGKTFRVRATGSAVTFNFDVTLTTAEITALDGRVTTHKAAQPAAVLVIWKKRARRAIDRHTRELIRKDLYDPTEQVNHTGSGQALKTSVNQSTTKAEIDAVVDNR